MWFRPSNPLDSYHSQIEFENFKENEKRQKDFLNSITEMTEASKQQSEIAVKKSKKADVKGWIAIFVSIAALAIEIIINYDKIIMFFT